MFDQSKILFETMPSELMTFVVFPGSNLFVDPGRYGAGAGMRIAGAIGIIDFGVSGSCMSINYEDEKICKQTVRREFQKELGLPCTL